MGSAGISAQQSLANGAQQVVVITGRGLGEGVQGEALLDGYLRALAEGMPVPDVLIFMNSGVFLTTAGSPVLGELNALEAAGAQVLSCGACLNFYGLQDAVAVGEVSNMYDFVTRMNQAAHTAIL